MQAIINFLSTCASAIASFFAGLWQLVKLVAVAYHAIPSYLGIWAGIFGVWIVAGFGCCIIFRVIGRE